MSDKDSKISQAEKDDKKSSSKKDDEKSSSKKDDKNLPVKKMIRNPPEFSRDFDIAEPLKVFPEYIFPLCDYCDFGWRFDSRKKVFCPYHGPQGQYIADMYYKDSSDQQRTAN
ncbi:hypothetical protein CDAR_247151 [Caerostris darwini]|uniref:Uncharacterized protein n=1 Tax=Caerostris darwini TaxID=1538125 RepID=A0AAV4TV24_9ARAC|nr:hypothetical protein CDAR_247151 [Caerostris darwini]